MISPEIETRILALEQQMAGILYALSQPVNQDGTAEAISPFSAENVLKLFGNEAEKENERK